MRKLLMFPMLLCVPAVVFAVTAVGQGHAQAPARLAAQHSTITQSFTGTGQTMLVSMTGQESFVGILQEKLSTGSLVSESFAGSDYAVAANGCFAGTIHGTSTFATPADTYDTEGVLTGCVAQGTASGHGVITGGTGRYKGAIGTYTFTTNCTLMPPKAGQPYIYNCSVHGSDTLTLAGQ